MLPAAIRGHIKLQNVAIAVHRQRYACIAARGLVQAGTVKTRAGGGWGGGWDDDGDAGGGREDSAAVDGGWGSDSNPSRSSRGPSRRQGGGGGGGWGRRGNTDLSKDYRRDGGRGGRGGGRDTWRGRGDDGHPDGAKPFYEAKPAKSTYLSKLTGEAVYGVAPVLIALQQQRRALHLLYVQDGMDLDKRKDASAVTRAINTAHTLEVGVEYISKHDLNMMADNRPHQGLLLDCGPMEWSDMETFPPAPEATAGVVPPLWLALDEQNLGAVLRSAYFLGAAGVLACKRNSAPLSGVVSKASAGALEAMTIRSCNNLPRTLQLAAENGWQVLGAGTEDGAVSCSSFVMKGPTILVVGNEGYGLRTNVRRACTGMVQVDGLGSMMEGEGSPGLGTETTVDSLNVSVAAGILLHSLLSSAGKRAMPQTTPNPAAPST